MHYLFRIPFTYLDSNVLPFTFHVEDGEIRSRSCCDEYDRFSLDLTQNTQGRLFPNIPGGSKYSGFPTVQI